MANVKVTYQQMLDQATKLTNARTEIEGQLTALKNQVDSLVAEGFVTDTASKSFQTSYDEFTRGAKDTIEGLDGMAKYLNTAARTFHEADTQLARTLNA
ncbi:MAG TPA: WXG100 family type VII secretion target [Frankiaceae bacterium]|nr:WXG100 family type VII secretion target [Frankiaceae bacterium]